MGAEPGTKMHIDQAGARFEQTITRLGLNPAEPGVTTGRIRVSVGARAN